LEVERGTPPCKCILLAVQIAEITAEEVKSGCNNAVKEGKCYPFY
jgi:hypothetical protein